MFELVMVCRWVKLNHYNEESVKGKWCMEKDFIHLRWCVNKSRYLTMMAALEELIGELHLAGW